jgi:rubredoxin
MPLPPIARERVCPNCGSRGVQRVRRRGLYVRVVCLIWGVRPFRCNSCDHLFLAPYGRKS